MCKSPIDETLGLSKVSYYREQSSELSIFTIICLFFFSLKSNFLLYLLSCQSTQILCSIQLLIIILNFDFLAFFYLQKFTVLFINLNVRHPKTFGEFWKP